MIFNENILINKIKSAQNCSEVKIFLYIALNQPNDDIKGFQTTKQQLAFDLNIKIRTVFNSLRWLKDNLLIHELKLAESVDFMVNPYIIMNNGDRDARIAEWVRRQLLDSEREQRLRKERRLRELRKQKKIAQIQNS